MNLKQRKSGLKKGLLVSALVMSIALPTGIGTASAASPIQDVTDHIKQADGNDLNKALLQLLQGYLSNPGQPNNNVQPAPPQVGAPNESADTNKLLLQLLEGYLSNPGQPNNNVQPAPPEAVTPDEPADIEDQPADAGDQPADAGDQPADAGDQPAES